MESTESNSKAQAGGKATGRPAASDKQSVAAHVARLNDLMNESSLQGPKRCGEYLIEVYFGGSYEKYREEGGDAGALREIVDHPDCNHSKTTVHHWLKGADLLHRAGRDFNVSFGHIKAVLGVPQLEDQVKLLEEAEATKIGTRELRERAADFKPKKKAGRPPDAPYVKTMNRSTKIVLADRALSGFEGDGKKQKAQRAKSLKQVRELVAALTAFEAQLVAAD